jgi:hypothetical protein
MRLKLHTPARSPPSCSEDYVMEARTHRLPLPKSEMLLESLILQLLRMPMLQELKLGLHGIEIRRGVQEGEPVVPESMEELAKGIAPPDPDVAYMLSQLTMLELEPDPVRHPLTTLIVMMELVRAAGYLAVGWYVCAGDGLDAFVCNPKGTLPKFFFGLPVHYVVESVVPEGRLVLVGSPTRFSIDAAYSVTAEIGV